MSSARKATVVGSGPNGLAAAITLARAGLDVVVHEAAERVGGGLRTEELTLPGFLHDVCSAIHPLGRSSACFSELGLGVDADGYRRLVGPLAEGWRFVEPLVLRPFPLDGRAPLRLMRELGVGGS